MGHNKNKKVNEEVVEEEEIVEEQQETPKNVPPPPSPSFFQVLVYAFVNIIFSFTVFINFFVD